MLYGVAFSKLALHVINQSMLKSNDKSRSIDQERPVNANSNCVSFSPLDKNYGPREYKSNKTTKLKLFWIEIKLKVKNNKKNHLITTNTIYHLLVMITIQQLPVQSNTLGCKRAITSCQAKST